MKILEVLSEVSFDWASIVKSIYVADENQKWFILYGTNITWSLHPQYPACQVVNLNDYIDFSKIVPSYVEFYFNNIPNLAVSIKIEDIRKSLPKRPLISNSNDYDGVPLHIENLTSGQFYDFSLTLSETISLEEDSGKNCKKYPTEKFASYKECDMEYVYNEMKNKYRIMPFWAAKNLEEVTNHT